MPKKGYKQSRDHIEKAKKNRGKSNPNWRIQQGESLSRHHAEYGHPMQGRRHPNPAVFSDESRRKMSESAKLRIREFGVNYPYCKPDVYTKPERVLESILVSLGLEVIHNKRICGYYPDFWVVDSKLLIECDGKFWHENEDKSYQQNRTRVLTRHGYIILRFWDYDIMSDNAVDKIRGDLQNNTEVAALLRS